MNFGLKTMTPCQKAIVEIVQSNLPLVRFRDRANIGERLDEKIMSGIGLSLESYGDVLQEVEDDFRLKHPKSIRREDKRHWRLAAFLTRKKYDSRYTLRVPDLSINDLVEIAGIGEWPIQYYEES